MESSSEHPTPPPTPAGPHDGRPENAAHLARPARRRRSAARIDAARVRRADAGQAPPTPPARRHPRPPRRRPRPLLVLVLIAALLVVVIAAVAVATHHTTGTGTGSFSGQVSAPRRRAPPARHRLAHQHLALARHRSRRPRPRRGRLRLVHDRRRRHGERRSREPRPGRRRARSRRAGLRDGHQPARQRRFVHELDRRAPSSPRRPGSNARSTGSSRWPWPRATTASTSTGSSCRSPSATPSATSSRTSRRRCTPTTACSRWRSSPRPPSPASWDSQKVYDYHALGAAVDELKIMTYSFSGPWSSPGPQAPLGWTRAVIDFARTVVPAKKIYMGLPFYGYDWHAGGATAVQAADAERPDRGPPLQGRPRRGLGRSRPELHRHPGREARAVVHRPPCARDQARPARVGFPDIGGVAIWQMYREDPGFWTVLERTMSR